MRIAICTLSAVLLSGCSWLGMGSGSSANGCAVGHNQYGGAWNQGAGCDAGYGGAYGGAGAYGAGQNGWGYGAGAGGYGANGYGAGYGAGAGGFGAGYGAGAGGAFGPGAAGGFGAGAGGAFGPGAAGGFGPGAGAGGYGANGYGAGYGAGAGGAFGTGVAGGFGPGAGGAFGPGAAGGFGAGAGGAFGPGAAGGVTTLGAGAGYGTALGGQYGQFATGGQVVGGNVQQIQGAPIYVPRPYPAYYQAPRLRLGGAALPLGLAGFAGVSSFNDGNVFGGEGVKPAGPSGRSVSALDAISYEDAFGEGDTYGAALEYDLDRNNTAFLSASRTEYDGQVVTNGTITQDNTASGGSVYTDAGMYEFSDLEQTTVEAGLRHYVGNNVGIRPYVSGSAGFTHNNDVTLTTFTQDTNVVTAPETQEIIRGSWQPTAAGMVGAEIAAGPNFGLGVETGLRWTNERATNTKSDDTWSIPVKVRGRIAF